MNDIYDDYDFTPSSNSTLSSLFDNSSDISENASLTYTAPKQPKPANITETQNDPTKVETTVICARVVQVWKLVNLKYSPLGKLGFAIIGSSTKTSFEVILYKDKSNVLMRIKLTPNFEISLKKDNFASFFDSLSDNWLIKFSNQEEAASILSTIEKYGAKVVKTEEKKETKPIKPTTTEKEEEASPENKAKADILNRIAKMGQSILPNKPIDTEEESSPDTTDTISKPLTIAEDKPVSITMEKAPQPVSITMEKAPQPVSIFSSNLVQPSMSNVPATYVMSQPIPYDPLTMYFTENRTHNNEVRMNLSHISDKLNHIMKLVEPAKSVNEPNIETLKSKIKVLELRGENLSRELTFALEENDKLKLEIQQKNVSENQEENDLKLFEKEEEIRRLKEINLQIETYKNNANELSEIVDKQKSEIESLQNRLQISAQDNETLKNDILKLENTISELQHNHQESSSKENFVTLLKGEMNGMYSNIVANLKDQPEVGGIIAQNIKSTTLKIIQKFQQLHGVDPDPS